METLKGISLMDLKAVGRRWLAGFFEETKASPLFVPPQVKIFARLPIIINNTKPELVNPISITTTSLNALFPHLPLVIIKAFVCSFPDNSPGGLSAIIMALLSNVSVLLGKMLLDVVV
jgi:hypothetical protein